MALFVISRVLGMAGQVRLTAWCKARWSPGQAMSRGLAVMALSFIPLIAGQWFTGPLQGLVAILLCATALTIGTMMVFPFEMATIARLSGGRLIGTYYGLYSLLSGIGILVGNLLSGAALDLSRTTGAAALPWLLLITAGLLSALAVRHLDRGGWLTPERPAPPAPEDDRRVPRRERRDVEKRPSPGPRPRR